MTPATRKVAGGGSFSTTDAPSPLQLSIFFPPSFSPWTEATSQQGRGRRPASSEMLLQFLPSVNMLISSHFFSPCTPGTWEGKKVCQTVIEHVEIYTKASACVCACVCVSMCQGVGGCECTTWSDPLMHVQEAA